jgi:hypothetical protein
MTRSVSHCFVLLVSIIACASAFAEDAALQAIQSEQAQGLTRFYQNMLQNPTASASERQTRFNTETGSANLKFTQLANERQSQNDNQIYNKVILPNGSRINPSQFDPNVDINVLMARYPASEKFGPPSDSAKNTAEAPTGGAQVQEIGLDGSKVPKEIEFIPRSKP